FALQYVVLLRMPRVPPACTLCPYAPLFRSLSVMDVLSLIGVLLAFIAILGGNFLEGGSLGVLLNAPAALIVVGGTVAACLLQTPLRTLKRAVVVLHWVLF